MNKFIRRNENAAMVKKKTQGLKKIEIKKIENLSNRQVTFSKRRGGLFKRASELCILSGAEVAIIVHSFGKRVFSFGHPSADYVVERFLSGDSEGRETCPAAPRTRDYNRHYSEVCKELDFGKKRREAIEEAKRAEGYGGFARGDVAWWDEPVDGLELEELKQYAVALDDLMKNVTMGADDLMLIQSSNSLPSATTATVAVAWNDTATFGVQNQLGGGFEYENCFLPLGFELGESFAGAFVKVFRN